MKLRAIHLFVLLLLALVLCSTLGSHMRENMTSDRAVTLKNPNVSAHTHKYKKYSNEGTTDKIEPDDPFQSPQANISANGYGTSKDDSLQTSDPSSIATTPNGQQVLATPQNTVHGVPSSNIPEGQQDLYILKSEVVPPVCPACPPATSCNCGQIPPPCPPCARCPEPAFACKKVPNYRSTDDRYLPRPILSDFSQFGM